MAIGSLIAEGRKRKQLSQESVSYSVKCSRESIAKYENGSRKIPKDLVPKISQTIDDPQLFFDSWEHIAGHVSIPYFDGDIIDQHPSSMKNLTEHETEEALKALEEVCWFKTSKACNEADIEVIRKTLNETLDAAASMVNLVACMCKEYQLSMNDLFSKWQLSLKIKQYQK